MGCRLWGLFYFEWSDCTLARKTALGLIGPRLSGMQVVKLWQTDLAKINPKAADSLANPEEYPNLFPNLQESLQAEAYLDQQRAVSVPAVR